ncbi:hypothetical protein Misp03_63100 [Microbispora sp. NBRC 16548]|nr:hypothetical protein Misp03_63100 [Microbispora sp. NBRC 16548]
MTQDLGRDDRSGDDRRTGDREQGTAPDQCDRAHQQHRAGQGVTRDRAEGGEGGLLLPAAGHALRSLQHRVLEPLSRHRPHRQQVDGHQQDEAAARGEGGPPGRRHPTQGRGPTVETIR